MTEKNTDIDADQVLSTCYTCEAVPEKSCTECGNLFCSNHGGERYILKSTDDGISLKKKMICDKCTPNQTIMKIIKHILIVIVVLITIFILVMATYLFFFMDHSTPSPSTPAEPAPVETVDPLEEQSIRTD